MLFLEELLLQVYDFLLMVFSNLGTHAALFEVLQREAFHLSLFLRLFVLDYLRLFLHKLIDDARLAGQVTSLLSVLKVFKLRAVLLPEYAHLRLLCALSRHATCDATIKFSLVLLQLSHRVEMILPVYDVSLLAGEGLVIKALFSAAESS